MEALDTMFNRKYEADILVIYHRSDLDGVCSAAVVCNYYTNLDPKNVDIFGWTYGDPLPEDVNSLGVLKGQERTGKLKVVFVCDVSFGDDTERLFRKWQDDGIEVIWIDHHKTAIFDKDGNKVLPDVKGIREVGMAACELTSKFLNKGTNRGVPKVVQYLSAYDVWDKDRFIWNDVMKFQYATRAKCGLDVRRVMNLIDCSVDRFSRMLEEGNAILLSNSVRNGNNCRDFAFEGRICGHTAICMNTLEFNSTTFDSVYDESKYDFMMPFAVLPNGKVRFSLYTAKKGRDCSKIAKKFGGGGHTGAAGFVLELTDDRVMMFLKEHVIDDIESFM